MKHPFTCRVCGKPSPKPRHQACRVPLRGGCECGECRPCRAALAAFRRAYDAAGEYVSPEPAAVARGRGLGQSIRAFE